jgi:hypothetical protein
VFDRKRAHATTTVKMETWMDLKDEVINKYNPAQVWSTDEAQLLGKGADEKKKKSKSIGVKGQPASLLRSIFSEHISLMSAMSLIGLTAPPFLIFTGKVNIIFVHATCVQLVRYTFTHHLFSIT